MRPLAALLIAASLGAVEGAGAQQLVVRPDRALEAKVDAYLAPLVAGRDFNGAVLVARGDTVLLSKGYGMANWELGVANTPHTRFRIASITKTFTAAAIELLEQRGLLRYDDRLSRFIPGFAAGDRITVEHLLLHASGVANPDYDAIFARHLAPDELIAEFRERSLLFEPGKENRYSNAGYILLARIVERVSGQSYETFVRDNLLAPAGMQQTLVDRDEAVITDRAAGYVPGPGVARLANVSWYSMTSLYGSGFLLSTTEDLLRWSRAVHGDRVVRHSALRYPYGWGKRTYGGRALIEQTGAIDGFESYLAVYEADGATVVCLLNVQAQLNDRCGQDVAAMLYGRAVEPPRVPRPVMRNTVESAAWMGSFSSPEIGTFHVRERDGESYVSWGNSRVGQHAMPIGRDSAFVRVDRSTIVFVRDSSGRVVKAMRSWGGPASEFVRLENR